MSTIDESHEKRDLLIHVLHDSHDRKTIKPLRWLVWSESSLSTLILLLGWERGPAHRCYQVKNKQTETTPLREKRGKKKKTTHARIQEFSPGGGPGQPDKKYRSQMANFKEIYIFQGSGGGPTFYRGGSNYFQGGGVQLLIPYRNPYNLWFSRGSGPPVPPPPGRVSSIHCDT